MHSASFSNCTTQKNFFFEKVIFSHNLLPEPARNPPGDCQKKWRVDAEAGGGNNKMGGKHTAPQIHPAVTPLCHAQ